MSGHAIHSRSNSLLLAALLFLLGVEPFFPESTLGQVVLDVMVSGILITAVWAVSRRRSVRILGRVRGPTSWTELALAWRAGDDRPALRAFLGAVRAKRLRQA